jgi:hypothetical protein
MCGGLLQPAYVRALAFGQSFVFGLFGLFGLVSHDDNSLSRILLVR